jgi:CelD/BcsL family acetyltransferase involved in cellulose biosynthesis
MTLLHSAITSAGALGASALSYQTLNELAQIEDIASQWDALLQTTNCNRAFSSSTWFIAACRHKPGVSPHVITVRRAGTLAGVLPLAITHVSRKAEIPLLACDYTDMVAMPDDRAVICGLLDQALVGANAYDSLWFARIRDDSNCLRAARERLSESELQQIFCQDDQKYPYIRLTSSYEEYLKTRRGKFRRNLLRALRNSEGNVAIRELHPSNFDPTLLPEVFLSLHLARFQGKSPFELPANRAFLQYLLPRLFIAGSLRVFALLKAESILALDLCMRGASSLCAWNGGFLPEAESWSPGNLLIEAELRAAHASGMEEYDLMRGSEDYKENWATDVRWVGSIEFQITNHANRAASS